MRFAAFLCASLLLSGCTYLFKPTPTVTLTDEQRSALQARQAALAQYSGWDIAGRLSVRAKDDAWSGKLRWRQSDQEFRIHFNAPFGQGAMQIVSHPQHGVEMRVADGHVFYADDVETLLYDHTGWELPVTGLRHWLFGLPNDNAIHQVEFDDRGRIVLLQQQNWHIEYKGYKSTESVDLPRKLTIKNDTLKMILVVDAWDFVA